MVQRACDGEERQTDVGQDADGVHREPAGERRVAVDDQPVHPEAGEVGGEPQYATCILREVAGDSGGVDAAGLADRQPAMIHHVGLVDLRIRQHAARLVDDGDYGVAAGAGKPRHFGRDG